MARSFARFALLGFTHVQVKKDGLHMLFYAHIDASMVFAKIKWIKIAAVSRTGRPFFEDQRHFPQKAASGAHLLERRMRRVKIFFTGLREPGLRALWTSRRSPVRTNGFLIQAAFPEDRLQPEAAKTACRGAAPGMLWAGAENAHWPKDISALARSPAGCALSPKRL